MDVGATESVVHPAAHMHGPATHVCRTATDTGTTHVAATHMHTTTAHVHGPATHVTTAHMHSAATHVHATTAHVAASASKMSTATSVASASPMPAAATVATTTVCERQTGYCADHRERQTTIANESRYHHDLPCFSRVLCAGRPDDRKRTFEPLTDIRNHCFFAGCGE